MTRIGHKLKNFDNFFPINSTLYRVIFAPCHFFALLHLQMILPHLKFAQTSLYIKEITLNIGNCQVFNSLTDNRGKRDEKNGGEYFPIYSKL